MINPSKLTFGTDPEFIITSKQGEEIYSEDLNFLGLSRQSSFGSDCGGVFEIRSAYHHNILYVVNSIKEILEKAYISLYGLRDTKWLAGHFQGKPIGGHIHIGNLSMARRDIPKLIDYLGIIIIDGLSQTIDNKDQRTRRRREGYGLREDYRTSPNDYYWDCPDKEVSRVEYRSPGSFLISPEVTFLNLILTKVTAMLFFKDSRILTHFKRRTANKKILRQIKQLMEECDRLSKEKDVQLGIELLDNLLKTEGNKEIDWNTDFKPNWGLV
jgi:hypothetical protein